MTSGPNPLLPGPKPYEPHSGLVLYAIAAGLIMIGFGVFRLRLPRPADSPYTPRSIATTYSAMIALGALLVVLAVRWRFFP